MRLPHPRLTVRRLMLLVALAALGFAGFNLCWRYLRLRESHQRFASCRAFLEEGRISAARFVEESRTLRDAQLGVCWTHSGRVAVARDHLDRATQLLAEQRRLHQWYRPNEADLKMAEVMIREDRSLLDGAIGPE